MECGKVAVNTGKICLVTGKNFPTRRTPRTALFAVLCYLAPEPWRRAEPPTRRRAGKPGTTRLALFGDEGAQIEGFEVRGSDALWMASALSRRYCCRRVVRRPRMPCRSIKRCQERNSSTDSL